MPGEHVIKTRFVIDREKASPGGQRGSDLQAS